MIIADGYKKNTQLCCSNPFNKMKRFNFLIPACLILCCALMCVSCKKDEEKERIYMKGSLSFDLKGYMFRNATCELTGTGIVEPTEGLNYTWTSNHFIPDSVGGQTVCLRAPDSVGVIMLTLIVSDPEKKYYDFTKTASTTVVDTIFSLAVDGFAFSSDSLIDPRDGHCYYYRRYGDNDWFVQNLNWEGAGRDYNDEPVLSWLYGRLYSWSEAYASDICPPGWRSPTEQDWTDLANCVHTGDALSFFDPWSGLGEYFSIDARLNGSRMWIYHPDNLKTNTGLWNALPSGYVGNEGDVSRDLGKYGFWWTGAQFDANNAYYRFICYSNSDFSYAYADKNALWLSVRCVRDGE